jgi:hypothetical protein
VDKKTFGEECYKENVNKGRKNHLKNNMGRKDKLKIKSWKRRSELHQKRALLENNRKNNKKGEEVET